MVLKPDGAGGSRASMRKRWLEGYSVWKKLADSDESDRVKLEVYYKAMVNSLPSSPIEHPLLRVRMWLSEKLHERSSMFDNMESAVSNTLRFAEAMGIRSGLNDGARQIAPITDPKTGEKKYTKEDNKCKFCSTWCCNNTKNTKLGCVMFNPDLDISCYPVQQQRFVRSGRAYLKENPSCESLKDQRFPLEPIGKGKGGRGGWPWRRSRRWPWATGDADYVGVRNDRRGRHE